MNQIRIKNSELGYLGNPNIKRDGVEQGWSSEEIREYALCMKDPVYFAKKYLKVISLDQGLVDLIFMIIKKKCLHILMIIDSLLY